MDIRGGGEGRGSRRRRVKRERGYKEVRGVWGLERGRIEREGKRR